METTQRPSENKKHNYRVNLFSDGFSIYLISEAYQLTPSNLKTHPLPLPNMNFILFLFPVLGTIAYILIGEPRLGTARAKRTGEMNRFYRNFVATHLADFYLDIADQVESRYHGISKVAEKGTGLGATKGNAMSLLSTTDASRSRR